MTPGQLVKAVSLALNVPEETVVQHDRNLVLAGLRTKGGRGRSAPEVTPRDAARLLVATLASIKIRNSDGVVLAFEKTEFSAPMSDADFVAQYPQAGPLPKFFEEVVHSTEKFSDPAVMGLGPRHNFVEAIASLIAEASGPINDREQYLERFAPIWISCEWPSASASISHWGFKGSRAAYSLPFKASLNKSGQGRDETPLSARYAARYGVTQRREATGTTLILLGRAFRENGLYFKTTKDAVADLLRPASKKPARRTGSAA